jgi:hypothetical protein
MKRYWLVITLIAAGGPFAAKAGEGREGKDLA